MKIQFFTVGLVTTCLVMTACVQLPDVYLIDRQTVMESEASGEWPELEHRFRQEMPVKGPEDLPLDQPTLRQDEQTFRILNGEMVPAQSSVQSGGGPRPK
ncbi:MAG: hypothetical protein KJ950_13300 [Proteobacteria bacterium]|nr:hypothetical protein [Pseudomonadota bacterium]MBU1686149.1 hypothetical protein [Pseudomonadota bacterium]